MAQEVKVTRTLLPAATIDDPDRKIYHIQYQAGELPPHFIYMPEKGYTKEKEAKAIAEDIKKRMAKPPGETITIGE